MTGSQYIGKAGHLAVMGEISFRGYNVALPEIDKGDDIFAVNDSTGAMWRLQVKTSSGRVQRQSIAYQFRIRESAIRSPQTPDLHFIFVMRENDHWRFLIMDRAVFRSYVVNNNFGTLAGDHRQVSITLHNDGRAICSGTNLQNHLEDWVTWPII